MLLHHGWERVDATIIDSRISRWKTLGEDGPELPVHEYVVEFIRPGGQVARLRVEERPRKVEIPGVGGVVPILVKPDGTEAVFDEHDPRINLAGIHQARDGADKDRFRSELG
jgi:hypothetical protein